MNPAAIPRIYYLWWIASFFLSVQVTAFAANDSAWLTRIWQTEDGLPNTYVNSVVQGQDGYVWVSTPVTLAKFDGIRFTRFPFRNASESNSQYQGTRQNQGARKIVLSRTGGLWITPVHGPPVYLAPDQSQVSAPETGLPMGADPATSFEDNDGNFWVATAGMIARVKNGKVTQFGEAEGMPKGAVYSLTMDVDGTLWLAKGSHATETSIVILKNGRFEPVTTIKGAARLAAGRTSGVWIASHDHLYKCDVDGALLAIGSFQPAQPANDVAVLLEDHAGGVWIGTDGNGLFRCDGSGFEKVETSYPKILCLTEDRENNLWVGTGGGGLDRISPRGVQMEGLETGSSLIGIQSICEDTNGVLWGATQNGLLVNRRDGRWSPPFTNALGLVTCVASHDGAVWIGTQDRALHCWRDNQFTTWDSTRNLAGNNIVDLLPSSKGDLWITEYIPNGVQCLHDGKLRSLTFPRDPGRIYAMAEDAAGNLWVATATGLLLRAEGDQLVDETSLTGVSGRTIRSLYATPDGALWIGYGGWGLGRLKDNHFAVLRTDRGLPDDYISQMIADDQGWLWFGSAEHGIFKIRQLQLEQALTDNTIRLRPVLYGRNEGLAGMEVFGNSPGALRSRDGRLWIPIRKALAVVNPKILHENPEPPEVILTRVGLDTQTIASYGGITWTQRLANLKNLATPLRLPPGYRRLEINFTALNFTAPENVHLQYQLENYDLDWADSSPLRSANYPHLTAGSYRFRVRACNADGLWNEAAAPLNFNVAPFFWQTWWFRFGVLALFTSTVIATVRYVSFRRLRMQLRTLEQQAVLDKERTRIARDLHDDLGCSLTHVALVLEMNEQKTATLNQPNGKTQLCSPMVRQVVKSVDEIIWAISPRNDHLQYLLDYIVEFAVDFLHAAGIHPKVDVPDDIPDQPVSPEVRHNLYLVVKEALNNVVRHAQAGEVRFCVTNTPAQLSIVIADNGRGFAHTPDNATADGLRNMRQRMEEIGGQCQIESRPGAGATVYLTYNWPRVH